MDRTVARGVRAAMASLACLAFDAAALTTVPPPCELCTSTIVAFESTRDGKDAGGNFQPMHVGRTQEDCIGVPDFAFRPRIGYQLATNRPDLSLTRTVNRVDPAVVQHVHRAPVGAWL